MCPSSLLGLLPFLLEYAVWRGWGQAVLYTTMVNEECHWAIVRLQKCMNLNGISVALADFTNHSIAVHQNVGIVLFTKYLIHDDSFNYGEQITKQLQVMFGAKMNSSPYDWVLTTTSEKDYDIMNAILNKTSIRFDQNFIAAYPSRQQIASLTLCEYNFSNNLDHKKLFISSRASNVSHKSVHEINYYKSTPRFKNLKINFSFSKHEQILPLLRSGLHNLNSTAALTFSMLNLTTLALKRRSLSYLIKKKFNNIDLLANGIHIVQYFKVRSFSTLYGSYLGMWHKEMSMSLVDTPYPVEARNFLGEDMLVGRTNITGEDAMSKVDDAASFSIHLDSILHYLAGKLNAKPSIKYFSKLGFRSFDGSWSGLLGGVVDGSVDVAVEPVMAHSALHDDLDFLLPLAETMCSIYMRHQETSTARDIFLAPFSWKLILCVLFICALCGGAISVISRLTPALRLHPRPIDYSEGLIWSMGILCQQGNNWTPPSPSASVVLITCLSFSIIIYNAYSAFITSVLSVRVTSVDTVADVLYSTNFKIGYIKNGADQMYLMSTKDAQLNAFYIRGYSEAENLVTSAEEGLTRAARSDYAFFAGQRIARSTLSSMSQVNGRCSLMEVPVPSSRAFLAFAMAKQSPYARPMMMSLLQLRNGGSLDRLVAELVPPMPKCDSTSGFASARVADVRSAFFLIIIGILTSFFMGVSEYLWKKRSNLARSYIIYKQQLIDWVWEKLLLK